MKSLNIFSGFLLFIMYTSNASAQANWGYIDYIDSIDPEVVASLENSSSTVRYTNPELSIITQDLYHLLSEIEYDIASEIEPELRSEIGRYNSIPGIHYSLRSFNVSLVDPFEIRLVGQSSGNVQAQVRFNVSLYARIRNTSNPLPSNVTLNYDTSEILFTGNYNLATGLLDNLTLQTLEGRSRSSASNAKQ